MTAVSKSQAKTDIAASFPDNTIGTISATGARTMFGEMVDSWVDTLLPGASTGTMVYWASSGAPTALVLGAQNSVLVPGATAPTWLTGVAGQLLQPSGGSLTWSNQVAITTPAGGVGLTISASTNDGAYINLGGASGTIQIGERGTGGVLQTSFGQLDFSTSNTVRFSVSGDGSFFASGAAPQGIGTVNASGIFDNGQRVFRSVTAPLTLSASGVGGMAGASGTLLNGVAGTGASFTQSPTLGVPGTTIGTLGLSGSSSPSLVTLLAHPNGASWTLRLPSSGGTNQFILSTDGSGNTSWVNGAQLPGTTTNDSASAGNIGQTISSTIGISSGPAMTSGANSNVTSINLTAGDWDAWGAVGFLSTASLTPTLFQAGVSPNSAVLAVNAPSAPRQAFAVGGSIPGFYEMATGQGWYSVSTTTPIYLVAYAAFGAGSCNSYGFIAARRRR